MSYNTPKEVFSGLLSKCGGKVKSWNKRWMILRTDSCLYYYKDVAKKPLGVISLRDPKFSVRFGERGDCAWPKGVRIENTLVLVTAPRTYFMHAETNKEAVQWKAMLEMSHDKLREDVVRGNRAATTTAAKPVSHVPQPSSYDHSTIVNSCPPGGLTTPEESPRRKPHEYEQFYTSPFSDPDTEDEISDKNPVLQLISQGGGQNGGGPDIIAVAVEGSDTLSLNGPQAIYDLAKEVEDRPELFYEEVKPPAEEEEDKPLDVYEPIDVSTPTLTVKNQPLPPIPIASSSGAASVSQDGALPIYEDIPGQPLYEDLDGDGRKSRMERETISEVLASDDEEDDRTVPTLPPKEDGAPPPLLPPRDGNTPPLPPKGSNNSPPSPRPSTTTPPPLSPVPTPREDKPGTKSPQPEKSTTAVTIPLDVCTELYDTTADDQPLAIYDEVEFSGQEDTSIHLRDVKSSSEVTPRTPPLSPRSAEKNVEFSSSTSSTGSLTPKPVRRDRSRSPASSPVIVRRALPLVEDKDKPTPTPRQPSPSTPRKPLSPPPTPTKTPPPLPPKDDTYDDIVAPHSSAPPLPSKDHISVPKIVTPINASLPSTTMSPARNTPTSTPTHSPRTERRNKPPLPSKEGVLEKVLNSPSSSPRRSPRHVGARVQRSRTPPAPSSKGNSWHSDGVNGEGWSAVYDAVTEEEVEELRKIRSPGGTGNGLEKGMVMFEKQKKKMSEVTNRYEEKQGRLVRAMSVTESSEERAIVSEALREVEMERLLASEERFRWERERMRLEEERKKFEEEKLKLQQELDKTMHQLSLMEATKT